MSFQRTSSTAGSVIVLGAIGGAVAGMMMAIVEMIYGLVSSTHSFWDAPMGIWAWVAGIDHFGQPSHHVWPIVLGIGGHMMNSMIIGVVFVAIVTLLGVRERLGIVMLGVAYALAVWVLMRYAILPLRSGEERLFTTSLISPQWVWWGSHAALGMTLGAATAIGAGRLGSLRAETGSYRHPHPAA